VAMTHAWEVRKRFGGGMRQSGILAAAALHGLDHHLARLPEDHAHARLLADRLQGAGGARVVDPDTNIVMLDLAPGRSAAAVARHAAEHDVLVSVWSPTRIRLVTHLDVSRADVERAAAVVAEALARD
jgi:threonine aldolase